MRRQAAAWKRDVIWSSGIVLALLAGVATTYLFPVG